MGLGKSIVFEITPTMADAFYAKLVGCTVHDEADNNFEVYPSCPTYLNVQHIQPKGSKSTISIAYDMFRFDMKNNEENQTIKCTIDVSVDEPTVEATVCVLPEGQSGFNLVAELGFGELMAGTSDNYDQAVTAAPGTAGTAPGL